MVTVKSSGSLDDALNKLAAKLSKGATLRAGFLEDKRYPDGTSVAMVAATNNFGSGSTPPRPFFTNAVAQNSPQWGEQIAKALERTDNDAEKALALMGEVISDQIRQSIIETGAPPNSMVTNLLKQRFPLGAASGMTGEDVWKAHADVAAGVTSPAGKVLIWSGLMLDSVDYEVTE